MRKLLLIFCKLFMSRFACAVGSQVKNRHPRAKSKICGLCKIFEYITRGLAKIRVMEKTSADCRSIITKSILELAKTSPEPPVFLCIGTDKVTGDSLGPLVGHLLTKRHNVDAFVYGTLSAPVTAKNLIFSHLFIRAMHPTSPLVAIDAALGAPGDVGLVKVYKGGIMPGSATNKNLPLVGDIGIMGVVNTTGIHDYLLLNSTRLNIVYDMAEKIAAAIADALAVPKISFAG